MIELTVLLDPNRDKTEHDFPRVDPPISIGEPCRMPIFFYLSIFSHLKIL